MTGKTNDKKREPLSFDERRGALLLELYLIANNSPSSTVHTKEDIRALSKHLNIPSTFITPVLLSLYNELYLTLDSIRQTYSINETAIRYIEKELKNPDSFLFNLAGERSPFFREITAQDSLDVEVEAHGEAIDASIGADDKTKSIHTDVLLGSEGEPFILGQSKLGTAPASDRIVDLNHNSDPYKAAMTSLNKVIAQVAAERSNDFEEKDRILGELDAGKRLMESLKVDPEKIRQVLGGALKWLAKKFISAPIGELAVKTWEFIKELIQ